LAKPRGQEIALELQRDLERGCLDVMRDAKVEPLRRRQAALDAAFTTLADVLVAANDHISMQDRPGKARAAHLDVAVKAARAAREFSHDDVQDHGNKRPLVQVGIFTVPDAQRKNVSAAALESGLDVSALFAPLLPAPPTQDAVIVSAEGEENG
jgi:hypothetical protein